MPELGALVSAQAGVRGRLLVIPLGATEQHGAHLPLDTDTAIASALARGLADALALTAESPPALVAPPLPYGSSGEHQGFPGTLSIGREALHRLLLELVRSATLTFERVLLLSAHGGNAPTLTAAVDQLRAEGHDVREWSPARAWAGAPRADAHAGFIETSVMLAIAPDRVREDRAAAGNREPLTELIGELARTGVHAVSENGVLGDPTGASASAGKTLLAAALADLRAFVAAWPDPAALGP